MAGKHIGDFMDYPTTGNPGTFVRLRLCGFPKD